MSASIEYKTVVACFDKLVVALKSDPLTVSNELVSSNLIPPLEVDGQVSAQKIAQLLLDKIKVAPQRYRDILEVFSRHDWLKDIVEILQSEYSFIEGNNQGENKGLGPSRGWNESPPNTICKHRECPLYKAPPCFSRSLEELLSNRVCIGTEFPDWKTFVHHFKIDVPVSEQGAVKYWTYDHHNREQHTIRLVLDFAENYGHSPLSYQFEKLIKDHGSRQANPRHVCTENPARCFRRCAMCKIRRLSELPPDSCPAPPGSPSESPPSPHEQDTGPVNPTPLPPYPEPPIPGPDEVIHVLAPSLFEKEYPYKLFLGNYWILEPIIVLFLAFQTLSSIYITLCEEGGAYAVFHDGLNMSEFINRVIIFSMRILVRVIAPFIFYRQLCSMSEAEKALQVKIKKEDYDLPPASPVPYRHRVTLWSIISHAVIFSMILFYLGAFLVAEDRLRDRSICIKEIFRFPMPLIGIRLVVFFDCLSCFFILMLIGLVKDCYCLENRLSTANDKYFEVIRKRWYRIDVFCFTVPIVLTLFSMASLIFGKSIAPKPDHRLDEGELEVWCFWMITLSLLLFFGSASNWTAKIVTVIGNVLALGCALFFPLVLGVDKATFLPGSLSILFYCHLSMLTINLLYCLIKAHQRHKGIRSKRFWFSLTLLILLTVSLFVIVIREVISLAIFIL